MNASRFLWRWSFRVIRSEWRQLVALSAIITLGVTISVGGILTAYNMVEPPQAEYGNGQFSASADNPDFVLESLSTQGVEWGTIQSARIEVDGAVGDVAVQQIAADNRVTAPLLDVVSGRHPTADHEVAITNNVLPGAPGIGSSLSLAGMLVDIVGIVENPNDLADEFVLVNQLDILDAEPATASIQLLIDADPNNIDTTGFQNFGVSSSEGPSVRTAAAIVVNIIAAVGLGEVALLIGAAFSVTAQRRSKQFGLLAASGATPKMVRRAAMFPGTILGLVGAATGAALAIGLTAAVIPSLETTVGHRIVYSVPILAIAPSLILTILAASLAARWPTNEVSRLPVVNMLRTFRPKPQPVRRLTIIGSVFAVLGAVAIGYGFGKPDAFIALLGSLLAPVGILALTPLLVRLAGQAMTRLPLPIRMAGRIVARHNRRSAALVSAMALALGIPIGISVVSGSIDAAQVNDGQNLPNNQGVVWVPSTEGSAPAIPQDTDGAGLQASFDRIRSAVPDIDIVEIQVLADLETPTAWEFQEGLATPAFNSVVSIIALDGDCALCSQDTYAFANSGPVDAAVSYDVTKSWVATPELLQALNLDDSWLGGSDSSSGALAIARSGEYGISDMTTILFAPGELQVPEVWPHNTSIPPILVSRSIAPDTTVVTIGGLVVSDQPFTAETEAALLAAVGSEMLLELPQPEQPQSTLRTVGLLGGTLFGLGIAIAAVGLLSTELAPDLEVLHSLGATPQTIRTLSASLAVVITFLGGIVALALGYLPLVALRASLAQTYPVVVPWLTLLGLVLGFPCVVGAVRWLRHKDGDRPTVRTV